jgi:hypothetical protein
MTATLVDHHELDVTAFGVRLKVLVEPPDLVPAVDAALPPGAISANTGEVAVRFALRSDDDDLCQLSRDGTALGPATEPEVTFRLLEEQLAFAVANHAKGRVFVRAGVVRAGDRAIVLPGASLSGRTTLVQALVREGAECYSDTFAVLDHDGMVHAYRDLGTGELPPARLRIGLIATVPYVPGASWAPTRADGGGAALALLAQAVASAEPRRRLKVMVAAAAGVVALHGERGEAATVAPALLSSLAA